MEAIYTHQCHSPFAVLRKPADCMILKVPSVYEATKYYCVEPFLFLTCVEGLTAALWNAAVQTFKDVVKLTTKNTQLTDLGFRSSD